MHTSEEAIRPRSLQMSEPSRAAYVFSLVGRCDRHIPALLAAATLLTATKPVFPLVAMLTPECHSSQASRIQFAGIQPILILPPRNLNCTGSHKRNGYFAVTFSQYRVFELTQFDAVLLLDSDLAVVRNLDHILLRMLREPRVAQVRTPQACFHSHAVSWHGSKLNAGVWGLRPSAETARRFETFLASGGYRCAIGIQDAAPKFYQRYKGFFKEQGTPLTLHAGYNLKGSDRLSISACLRKQRLNASDVFIVHWSGTRKPWDRAVVSNSIETRALTAYLRPYCAWSSALNISLSAKGRHACRCVLHLDPAAAPVRAQWLVGASLGLLHINRPGRRMLKQVHHCGKRHCSFNWTNSGAPVGAPRCMGKFPLSEACFSRWKIRVPGCLASSEDRPAEADAPGTAAEHGK